MTDNASVHSTASSHHRFHFLDALRGIAAILVVFLHAPGYIRFRPVHNAYLAVDFFFCLSGFVIAFSYEKRLQDTLTLKRFLAARAIRLYPTYALGIALGLVPLLVLDLPRQMTFHTSLRLTGLIVVQTCMLPPLRIWYNNSLFPLDFPAWSMFFEVLANIAYAWMVRRRVAGAWQLGAVILTSFAVIGCWLLQGGTLSVGQLSHWTSFLGIFRVALSFLVGVLIFRLFHRTGTPHWAPLPSGLIALAAASATILLLIGPFAPMRSRVFTLITVTALSPGLVYLGARCRLSTFWHGPCRFLGDLSYPLYLVHAPFMRVLDLPWIMRAVHQHPAIQPWLVTGVLAVAGTASVVASKYYDVPLRGFLTRRYNAHLREHAVATQARETMWKRPAPRN